MRSFSFHASMIVCACGTLPASSKSTMVGCAGPMKRNKNVMTRVVINSGTKTRARLADGIAASG
jgi:hypothetical protein